MNFLSMVLFLVLASLAFTSCNKTDERNYAEEAYQQNLVETLKNNMHYMRMNYMQCEERLDRFNDCLNNIDVKTRTDAIKKGCRKALQELKQNGERLKEDSWKICDWMR